MSLIDEAVDLVSSQVHWMKTCLSITRLEATLAGLSVYPLLVLVCLFMVCFMGFWCTSLLFLGLVLMQALGNLMVVLGLICVTNALLLCLILRYLHLYLKRMRFEKTRAYLLGQRGECA
ncbi:MAG TPA: hypothetical protein DDY37_06980 [Legionella sp.]|nr:hypothetical protein [Legionella sp.]